jgi:hypothetical protein
MPRWRRFSACSFRACCRGTVRFNHRAATDIVRFTCSFMQKGLSGRGRILPLYRASLERLPHTCRLSTFVTPFSYPHMIRLIQRWMAPVAERVTETRGVSKALGAGVTSMRETSAKF